MRARGTLVVLSMAVSVLGALAQDDDYLHWTAERASTVAASAYKDGKVGSRTLLFWTGIDTRWLKTERAQSYKLRATWFTPEVIRASARWAQLRSRLAEEEVRQLVREAEGAGDTVMVVDIDPNEGSGVIPTDWEVVLRPLNAPYESGRFVHGTPVDRLRKVRALQTIEQRNYDYDRFWVVFPLTLEGGAPLFGPDATQAELIVRIYNREGSVTWPIPPSIRSRVANSLAQQD